MNSLFEKFYKNIKLTKNQRVDAKTKYNGVCEKLHSHYYPDTEYNGKTKVLIGSYAKKTNIRPPRDVDVIFLMPEEKFKKYDDYKSNGQNQLLQDVKEILKEKYTTTEKIKGWGKVVLIKFSDGKHNVELLPAWKNKDNTFTIPNSSDGGKWEIWDPLSEIQYITDSNKSTNGLTKKIIRMVKKWSEYCNVDIKSYQIEIKVVEFLFNYDYENNFSYSQTIKDFFNYLKQNNDIDGIESKVDSAISRSTNACLYEKQDKKEEACGEWQKIFGYDFVKLIKKQLSDEILKLNQKYPSEKEEFLTSKYNIPIRIDDTIKFKIDAEVTMDSFRKNRLSYFILNNLLLLKMKEIIFFVDQNNISGSYEIFWKVRNFGDEAMEDHDLRGEISKDTGHECKVEHTKYKGKHYVECYLVQNNICVATDKISVPIGY